MNALRELFETAIELPQAARAEWLTQYCPDPAQRALLERMLAADAQDALGSATQLAAAIGEPPRPRWTAGARVGGFELIAPLGEGGHASVYRAMRESAGVRQEVALKLLHRGLHAPDAQRQFRRERVALAQLQHPDIARLIEGGVDADGQAFIALELVDGQPITDYVRTHALGLSARLDLFLRVCRAVEAAHRALIVHRDLKPSNVLVTREGRIKLLDFGVAKLLQGEEDETRTQAPAFTPAYAAPEQREHGAITTATDVYALGVLLGELLTGQRLNDGSGRTPSSHIGAEPERGMSPAPAPIARRQLHGDLDNIVLKALAAEPEQRYASAGAFADDIERFLDGQPVNAHPPSRAYRFRKFVARHRLGAIATTGFALALLILTGVALRQAQLARQASLRAEAMRHFMVSAFKQAQPGAPRDGPPRITEVVETAIERARNDAGMHRSVRTELLSELGAVLRDQGDLDQARATLQWNYEQARDEFGERDALTLGAGLELLRTQILSNDLAPARAFADALLAQVPPSNAALRSQVASASAWLAVKERNLERALREGREAVALARAVGNDDLLAEALSSYSHTQFVAGDAAGAAATSEEHLALRARQFGAEHMLVAIAHSNLSRIYRRSGDLAAAQRHIDAALAIDAKTLPPDDFRRANHLNALTALRREQGDFAAALTAATEGLRINRLAFGDAHPYTITDLVNLGSLQLKLDRPEAALAPLREALAQRQATLGETHVQTAGTRATLGLALGLSGDRAAGETMLRAAIATLTGATDAAALTEACAQLAQLNADAPAACEASAP